MEKFIYVNNNSQAETSAYDHCYFQADADHRICREVNLKTLYPYTAFPVNYREHILCSASKRDNRPVKVTDGRYIREAEVLRITSLGVVSLRFTDSPRLLGK